MRFEATQLIPEREPCAATGDLPLATSSVTVAASCRIGRSSVPSISAPAAATAGAYSSTLCRPAHGAAQRPSSCKAHGLALAPRAGIRWVHDRSGTMSSTVSTAATACCRERNGPNAPSRGVVTTDSRGNASTVGVTHQARCGLRERRL